MKTEKIKTAATALNELNESSIDLLNAVKETTKEVKDIKKLWRDGNKSRLIKLGLTLIVFPEPTPNKRDYRHVFCGSWRDSKRNSKPSHLHRRHKQNLSDHVERSMDDETQPANLMDFDFVNCDKRKRA